MAGRVASDQSHLRNGRGAARSSDRRAGKQMRSNAPADGAKGQSCTKPSFEKARLVLGSVSTTGYRSCFDFELRYFLPLRVVIAAKKAAKDARLPHREDVCATAAAAQTKTIPRWCGVCAFSEFVH
jgi:hypothetical protein